MNRRFLRQFREYDSEKPEKATEISGLLGIPIGGAQQVEVPNRNGFVYVRLRNNTSELIQAYNEKVSPVYGLPVLVIYKDSRYEVLGRDTARYSDWGSFSSYLPRHGSQHSLNFEDGQGGDVTFVYSRQMMPFAPIPSGTVGAGTVFVMPHVYRNPVDASWNYIGDQSSPEILPAKPTGSTARMMLLYWDLDSASPKLSTGTHLFESLTGTASVLPYIPILTNTRHIPLAGIRLVSGTESILWDNIYDMRQWATTSPPFFDGGFSVWDEGVPIGTGSTFNFVGDKVVATRSGSVIRVNVTAQEQSFADTIGIAAMDDGSPVGTGSIVNFQSNLSVVRSGTVLFVDATGGGGGGGGAGGVVGKHLGEFLSTGTIIDVQGSFVTSGSTLSLDVRRTIMLAVGTPNSIPGWQNMPAADTSMGADVLTSLYGFTQARMFARLNVSSLNNAAYIHVKYSIDDGATFSDMAVNPDDPVAYLLLSGTNGRRKTDWFSITPSARVEDVWLRFFGTGGNGVIDPSWFSMGIEFR